LAAAVLHPYTASMLLFMDTLHSTRGHYIFAV